MRSLPIVALVLITAFTAACGGPLATASAGPTASAGRTVPPQHASPMSTAKASSAPVTEPTVDPVIEPATPITEPALGEAPIGPTESAAVVRIVDGDTIVIDRGNGPEKLRYIGVDTPETVKPGSPVEFMGKEASAANKALVEGRQVRLERDITEYDRYDRLLRYVWVEDPSTPSGWLLVNLALVARGYAQVVTYPPDVRYVDEYLAAQRTARDAGLGLWGMDSAAGDPATAVRPSPAPARGADGCDPAYPDVCIAPGPPDLDCGDVAARQFRVLAPDPHRFDGDHNGIGCERD